MSWSYEIYEQLKLLNKNMNVLQTEVILLRKTFDSIAESLERIALNYPLRDFDE